MSYNIHLKDDDSSQHAWENRKALVAAIIKAHKVDIVGLQEPFLDQVHDLELFLPEFSWYGIGLEDGKVKGPINAVFYRHSRFSSLKQDTFFLSPTPDVASCGWDGKYNRGVSWVKLHDKEIKKDFYCFNTHFDYHGPVARAESAYLLKEKIFEISSNHPFIITGDFNLFPTLGGKEIYHILTQEDKKHQLLRLYDAQRKTLFPHFGPTGSWSGFKEPGQPGIKPDYIFVSKDITVISHSIISDTYEGKFPSDHLPVVAELDLSFSR